MNVFNAIISDEWVFIVIDIKGGKIHVLYCTM